MSEQVLQLSKSCSEMLRNVVEETRKHNFDSVNIPTLLFGVVNATTDDGDTGPLQAYLFEEGAYPSEVDDNLSLLITEYCAKLQEDYEEAHSTIPEKKSLFKRNSSKGKSKKKSAPSKKKHSDEDPIPMTPDMLATITFTDNEGKKLKMEANADVLDVATQLFELVGQYPVEKVDTLHIIVAMFMADNEWFKTFFKRVDLNYLDAKKHFKPEQVLNLSSISFNLAGFMHIFNQKLDATKPCEILCRDKESEQLWNIMLKKNKRNAVIVGEAGVGKTALVEKITYDIESCSCPPEFQKFRVISLDVNSLIAGTSFRGDAENRIKDIIAFLEKNNDVILFIDEVHTILGAGSCSQGEMDLANALKPILARGDTIVIGATTEDEYEKYFKKDAALSRRFEKVVVKEPAAKDVYPMIRNKIAGLSEFHGVQISKNMVTYAIMIANCFAFEKKNPDKTLDLIDRAMVAAKRAGKSVVDQESILKNFGIFFCMWDKMSECTRKETAYHEAGHYIVGKASEHLVDRTWLAVSIMPAENYLGVTVSELNEDVVPFTNYDYFIDEIAFNLAGRASEEMFTQTYTAGASSDLDHATRRAFQVVTEFALDEDSEHNRIFLNSADYPMFSERGIDIINEKVDKLVDKAFARAKELLEQNKDILVAIVDALMEKHIMSEDELDAVWQETVKKREP